MFWRLIPFGVLFLSVALTPLACGGRLGADGAAAEPVRENEPSRVEPALFAVELGRVACESAYACGCDAMKQVYPTVDECAERFAAAYDLAFDAWGGAEPQCASKTLDVLQTGGCQASLWDRGCELYKGEGLEGEACRNGRDCAPDLSCGITTDGFCGRRGSEGDECKSGSDCALELVCAGVVCTRPAAEGSACQETLGCEPGLECEQGRCIPAPKTGEVCTGDCRVGAYCDMDTRVCMEKKSEGGSCEWDWECWGRCVRGSCVSAACELLLDPT